jgi:GNAT superfamily N-acetyltransferase
VVREAVRSDLPQILRLYLYLHETDIPPDSERLGAVWESILADEAHHLIVDIEDGVIVSSCVCVIIPNLTRGLRPYALIENVVTHGDWRGRGCASACLDYALKLAKEKNCYKMMLLTGSKDSGVLRFYRSAGYNDADKTAFVRWID